MYAYFIELKASKYREEKNKYGVLWSSYNFAKRWSERLALCRNANIVGEWRQAIYMEELGIRLRVRGGFESVLSAAALVRARYGVAHLVLFNIYKHLHTDFVQF